MKNTFQHTLKNSYIRGILSFFDLGVGHRYTVSTLSDAQKLAGD